MPEPIIDNLNRLKVTDKNGNAYVLLPVDTEARQEIEEAKNIQFDSSFFTAEEDAVNGEVNIGLNGVPIGVSSPLRFDQDTAQGIVIGIDTSAVTPAEMTGATASTDGTSGLVPAPDAGDQGKFFKGDGTWTTIEIAEQKVHVLSKTTGLTSTEFDQAWTWLETGHLVGVWYDINGYKYLFLADKYYTPSYGPSHNTIVFSYIRNPVPLENQYEGMNRDTLSWIKSGSALTWQTISIMPSPLNQFDRCLYTDGRGGAPYWKEIKEVPSSTSSDSGKVLMVGSNGTPGWDTVPSVMPSTAVPTGGEKWVIVSSNSGGTVTSEWKRAVYGTGGGDRYSYEITTEGQGNGIVVKQSTFNNATAGQVLSKSLNSGIYFRTVNEVPSSTSSDEGKLLSVNASGNAAWTTVSPFAPAPSVADSLLLGDASGDKAWTPLLRGAFGTPLLDEDDEPVLDEQTGKPVYDANATSDLWTSFADHGFGAQRSYGDQDGNNIKATYATKAELSDVADGLDTALDTLNDTMEAVAHAGMYDLGQKDESDLDDGALAISCGNSTTELELTTRSTLTVLANPGVANFALLVDNTGNSNDVTVTVKDSTGANTFYQSTAAGNTVGAGKICQVTCVGKCWTLAEFEAPA